MAETQPEKQKTRLELAINALPHIHKLLMLVVVVGMAVAFFEPLSFALQDNIRKVEVFGVSFEFSPKGPLHQIFKEKTPAEDFESVFRPLNDRLQRVAANVAGAKVLWIDDNHPRQNIQERDVLREMGLFVEIAKSADEAELLINDIEKFNLKHYDVIVSDNTWGENKTGGQEFFGRLAAKGFTPKCILYTGRVDPKGLTPNYVFGLTNRYDELCHLIMDALERNVSSRVQSVSSRASVTNM